MSNVNIRVEMFNFMGLLVLSEYWVPVGCKLFDE